MNKHFTGLMSAAALAVCAMSAPALAVPTTTTQTINLGTVFTGTVPNGTAPWLVATFSYEDGSNTGTLTLNSHLTDGNFLQGGTGKITGWNFFLNNGFSLSSWTCAGSCADSVRTSLQAIGPQGPNGGLASFNLGFGWLSGDVFEGNDAATYTLMFSGSLNSNPFGANGNGWWSAAHVQGINVQGCSDSGWIASGADGQGAGSDVCGGGHVNVPEPSSLGLLGLGTLLMGLGVGLRRRFS